MRFSPKILFHDKKGFTLVEIIVAAGIISILIGATTAYIQPFQQINRGKDAQRQADVARIRVAMETYYNDHGCYPTSIPFGSPWPDPGNANTVYMDRVPQDPNSTQSYFYSYQQQTSGTPCPQWGAVYAKLAIQPNDTQIACKIAQTAPDTCVPSDYSASFTNSIPKYICGLSGKVDCQISSTTGGGTAGTQQRCRTYYCDQDDDGHYAQQGTQLCLPGTSPPPPPAAPAGHTHTPYCQTTVGDDCNDLDPTTYANSYCYMDTDGDGYTVNTAIPYCGGTPPLHCIATPSATSDCNDSDPAVALTRQFYPDSDHDGQYASTIAPVCSSATSSTTPPQWYSATPGTDCDDTNVGKYQMLSCRSSTSTCFAQTCAGSACPAGSLTSCDTGQSSCTTGTNTCCYSLTSDNSNCGACGNTCGFGTICSSGVCVVPNVKSTPGLAAGLVSYWKMDNNSSLVDNVSHNDIIGNNTTNTSGKLLTAQSFNGTNSRGDLSGNINITSTGSWTFQAWFKGTSNAASPTHYWLKYTVFGTNASPGWAVLGVDSGKIAFSHYPADGSPAIVETGVKTITDGQWHHLIWANSNDSLIMYVDGIVDTTLNSAMRFTDPISAVGTSWSNWPALASTVGYMNGSLDELAYWNRQISATEVGSLYASGNGLKFLDFSPDTGNTLGDNLLAWWKLDETTGNINDATKGNHNGDPGVSTSTTGVLGNARTFNGGAGPITFAPKISAMTAASSWSASAWYKGTNTASDAQNRVANPIVGSDHGNFGVGVDGGKIAFFHYATSQYVKSQGTTNVSDGLWHHLVWVNSASSLTMYVDGTPQGSFSSATNSFWIGSSWSFQFLGATTIYNVSVGYQLLMMNGTIDEIGVWNRTLTQLEINDLYNSGHGNTFIKAQ